MTDFEAVYGAYRAITCEWIGEKHNDRCRHPVDRGRSYCDEHHARIYRTVSTKDAMKEAENAIKTETTPILEEKENEY